MKSKLKTKEFIEGYNDGVLEERQRIKEIIESLEVNNLDFWSFEENHLCYPWRNSSSYTKGMVRDINNLIILRLKERLFALLEDKK